MIRLAEKHFRGQISALLTAETTRNRDRLEWELAHASRDASMAAFAGNHELPADCRSLEHGNSIGEYKAKV